MAEYLNSDRDLLMTRKFGHLHTRVLLDLQSEIICLEEDLRGMDEHDAKNNPAALKSRGANERRRQGFTRRSLLQNINSRLAEYREYDSLSSSFSLTGLLDGVVERIRSFESLANLPPLRKFKAFARHILEEVNLDSRETTFLQQYADLVAIAEGGERNWLDRIMKETLGWRLSKDVLLNCCRAFDSKVD